MILVDELLIGGRYAFRRAVIAHQIQFHLTTKQAALLLIVSAQSWYPCCVGFPSAEKSPELAIDAPITIGALWVVVGVG